MSFNGDWEVLINEYMLSYPYDVSKRTGAGSR